MAFEARLGDTILRDRYYSLRDSPSSENRELFNTIERTIKEKLIINPTGQIRKELPQYIYTNMVIDILYD
jgi:hypothetical protein